MNAKCYLMILCAFCFVSLEAMAFVSSKSSVPLDHLINHSCKEFKELMTAGNQIHFLRSDIARNNSKWKAVVCLQCNDGKLSLLNKVTSLQDGSVDWQINQNHFVTLNEIISSEDDPKNEIISMHGILAQVRKTCKAGLDPVNEGSHLQLLGKEQCVRHEYLRLYLKRKFKLSEEEYLAIESKKDLNEADFHLSCQNILDEAINKNIAEKAISKFILATKDFFGIGLGEYDPIVSRDSKSFYREIATKPSK